MNRLLGLQISLVIIIVLTISMNSIGSTYYDIYGVEKLENLEKIKDRILVIYLDDAYDDKYLNEGTAYKTLTSGIERISQLAEEFEKSGERQEVYRSICLLMVFTPEESILPEQITFDKNPGTFLRINRVDKNMWNEICKINQGQLPAAILDMDSRFNIVWKPECTDVEQTFQSLFLPKEGSVMKDKIQSSIKQRISEAINNGDKYIKAGKNEEGRASYTTVMKWLKEAGNPVLSHQDLFAYYSNISTCYMKLAGNGITQTGPQVWELEKADMRRQDLETSAECLDEAIKYNESERELYKLFQKGLVSECQGKLEDARVSYEQALSQKPGWTEADMSLARVKEMLNQVILYINQEVSYYDGIPKNEENFYDRFEQMLIDELASKGYNMWTIAPDQYEKLQKLLKQSGKDSTLITDQKYMTLTGGRILSGKVNFTISKLRPEYLNLIVAEGNIQLSIIQLEGSGIMKISASIILDAQHNGIGKNASLAVEDLFEKNKGLFNRKLNQFLNNLNKP